MSASALNLLLEHAEAERDRCAQALHLARTQAQAARTQADELGQYRQGYVQRWSTQFSQGAGMPIVQCYQSFGARLDLAVQIQDRSAQSASAREAEAGRILLQAEQKVMALRQLIQRRQQEVQHAAERQAQRNNDEFAARMHRHHAQHNA